MNTKEVSELRRRWQAEKNAVKHIYGCYVNASGEIVADLDEPLSLMPQEEAEQYFSLLKKALSGKLGKNLLDLVFSTQQVADSDEHRLLMSLRDSELQDLEARQAFYQKAVESLHLEGSYLLLLAHDTYDVPTKAKDGAALEDGENVFSYILCAACPVKEGKPGLGYYAGDNEFHCFAPQTVAAPECGFLFPAFDDRAANLYNALFYCRKPDALPQEFIETVFHTDIPMAAEQQKETFRESLAEALGSLAAWTWSRWCTASWMGCSRSTRSPAGKSLSPSLRRIWPTSSRAARCRRRISRPSSPCAMRSSGRAWP